MVYVLNINKEPLMPCTKAKARKLLKENKAVIVDYTPFTIQLTFECENQTQDITLGVDAGSKMVGLSATTTEKELFSSEVELRTDIVDKLSTRRQNRRTRRNRLRYRKPRFLNRVSRKKKGWLAPSIEHKINTHLKVIENVHKILPITKIIVETASFDIQKIKNPNISGTEYQQGEMEGWNVREYILFRDNHTCQHCKGKSKDKVLNVHHIESRKIGGNAPNNLITLCRTCHKDYHAGKINLKIKRSQSFKDATFMGVMRWTFYNRLKEIYSDVNMTFGYITKNTRITNGLEKSHRVDARCISGNPLAKPSDEWYHQKKVRCNNRQIHKAKILKNGKKKLNQAPYIVKGYRLFDKVSVDGVECFVFGRRATGYFDLRMLDGSVISRSKSYKKLKLLQKRQGLLIERRTAVSSHD